MQNNDRGQKSNDRDAEIQELFDCGLTNYKIRIML